MTNHTVDIENINEALSERFRDAEWVVEAAVNKYDHCDTAEQIAELADKLRTMAVIEGCYLVALIHDTILTEAHIEIENS